MTIQDLYDLFLVDYDKVSSITSYPSFTTTEITKLLNLSLIMLINQKFTGNNNRKIGFEGDSKRIADLLKLVQTINILTPTLVASIENAISFSLPSTFMLYINSTLNDTITTNFYPVDLVTHIQSKIFEYTPYNHPWIKRPVCYISNGSINVLYDTTDIKTTISNLSLYLTYIISPTIISITNSTTEFQFNDSVAYEVVNLAVVLALENIESLRTLTNNQILNIQE